jgi:transcriptional regulator with XRE-family HTH domain
VRDLRLARAVTQEELAAVLGVKRESMSRYESGERAITIALLLDIAAALEQPITAFLPGGQTNGTAHDAFAEVSAALQERPDLIPSVLDLLAVLREEPR